MHRNITSPNRRRFLRAASMLPFYPEIAGAGSGINLVNIGDHGQGGANGARRLGDLIVNQVRPDLIFTNGDNSYGMLDGKTFACNNAIYQPYIDAGLFAPCLGNHDKDVDNGEKYQAFFNVPRYYSRTVGSVLLVSVDSTQLDHTQVNWAKETLENSSSRWKLLYTHYPPYVSSKFGGKEFTRLPWHHWGADIVFSGHSHAYERIEHSTGLYIVNGLGGKSLYEFATPVTGSAVRFNGDFGYIHITGSANLLTLKFITQYGNLIDSRTVEKPMVMAPINMLLDLP